MTSANEPQFPVMVGRCVYCDAQEGLTDEHIIPLSLGGTWQLLKASCGVCQRITSQIERHVSREHFLAVRTAAGFPTYHPSKRPKTLPQRITVEGQARDLAMAPEDHPAPILLIEFDPPAFLTGNDVPEVPVVTQGHLIARGRKIEKLRSETGASSYSVPLPDRVHYARFIAKIGLCFAVAAIGLDRFQDFFVRGAILGRTTDVAKWVGCVPSEQWTGVEGAYECVTVLAGDIVQVAVRLFGMLQGPEYRVVVGRIGAPAAVPPN